MLHAKDIMSIDVFSVRKDTILYEAVKVMLSNRISGLPVVDDDMSLLGIITEKDMLELYEIPQKALSATVGDFMTTPAMFFEENATINDICKCLIRNDFRRVPVTSDGKVVGIVSRPDVIQCVFKALAEQKNSEYT